jgi:hypothetical protein
MRASARHRTFNNLCPPKQAAEKRFTAVILSEAKNLALRIFMNIRDSSFAVLRTACGSSE